MTLPYNDGDIVQVPSCDQVMQFWRYPDGEGFWVGFGRKAQYPTACVDLSGAVLLASCKTVVSW